jgi:hypothetical protein
MSNPNKPGLMGEVSEPAIKVVGGIESESNRNFSRAHPTVCDYATWMFGPIVPHSSSDRFPSTLPFRHLARAISESNDQAIAISGAPIAIS